MKAATERESAHRLLARRDSNGNSNGQEVVTFRSELLGSVYAPVREPLKRVQGHLEVLSRSQNPRVLPAI